MDTTTHKRLYHLMRKYFWWLAESAWEDISQVCWVAILENPGAPFFVIRRSASLGCERLARDLGWRRTREKNKREWMPEERWLARGPRRQGAPLGNQNRKGGKKNGDIMHSDLPITD